MPQVQSITTSTPLYKEALFWVGIALVVAALAGGVIAGLALSGHFDKIVQFLTKEGTIGLAAGSGGLFIIGASLITFAVFRSRRSGAQRAAVTYPEGQKTIGRDAVCYAYPGMPRIATTEDPRMVHRSHKEKLAFQLKCALAQQQKFDAQPQVARSSIEEIAVSLMDNPDQLPFGGASTQGARSTMEDAHVAIEMTFSKKKATLYAVMDGHGGSQIADEVAGGLCELQTTLSRLTDYTDETITDALTQFFVSQSEQMRKLEVRKNNVGTCMAAALVIDDRVYLPNIGDSRTILVRKDGQFQLTEDAKPGTPRFDRATEKAGLHTYGQSVESVLGVARDMGMKWNPQEEIQGDLPCRPKITRIRRGEGPDGDGELFYKKGDHLVIACDGLWDVFTPKEVGEKIREMKEKSLEQMAEALVKEALEKGSTDNISVQVVQL